MQAMLWKFYTALIGTVSTIATQKIVSKGWEVVTGEEPPEPGDPNTPLSRAIGWSLSVAVGVGIVQLLTNRATVRRMREQLHDEGIDAKKVTLIL